MNNKKEEFNKIINQSIFLHQKGKNKEALDLTQAGLKKFPNNFSLLKNAGSFASMLGQARLAEKYMLKGIKANPNDSGIYNNLGILYKNQKKYYKAEKFFKKSLIVNPNDVNVYNNLGNLYKQKNQYNGAEKFFKKSLTINPNDVEVHNNIGNLYKERKDYRNAEDHFKKAIEIDPKNVDAYYNLGVLYKESHQYDKAVQFYKLALDINPNHINTQNNLSLLLLTLGDYSSGWRAFEYRYNPKKNDRNSIPPNVSIPQYNGENLSGKTLLIYPEQGYGDEIQFVRYIPIFKKEKKIKKIILVCKSNLKKLFSSIDCIDSLVSEKEFNQSLNQWNADYWMFIMSFALYSNTQIDTIPNKLPYLWAAKADKEYWQAKLPNYGYKIGLVWKGNAKHGNDTFRSLPSLMVLKPLWSLDKNFVFVSLQKGANRNDFCDGQPLINLANQIKNFHDTASIISQLDLVISVDTSVAHLAGSLGKKCWVLLPKNDTDWRWLLERSDSPWYPKVMRLFRQTENNNWNKVVNDVRKSLKNMSLY